MAGSRHRHLLSSVVSGIDAFIHMKPVCGYQWILKKGNQPFCRQNIAFFGKGITFVGHGKDIVTFFPKLFDTLPYG